MKKLTKVLIFSLLITNFSLLAIGRTDVVGYTTRDWQFTGPVYTRCRTDLINNKIHVCWIGDFTIAANYNCYDCSLHTWLVPNGTALGFSPMSMDNNPITGGVIFSGVSSLTPFVVDENYSYCYGPSGYSSPIMAISNNQAIHIAMISDSLYYSRVQPWGTWSTPIAMAGLGFPCYNIAASEISNKVAIIWLHDDGTYPEYGYYCLSNDGGITWQPIVQLPFPPSVGLVPGYNSSSLFAMFDNQDNLHIVVSVSDTGYTIPCEIWHYCPSNPQPWTLVHHYDAETLTAPVGYNAIFACRPSITQDPTTGYFYVVWEQFDSLNYEPITCRARADIYVAELRDNGQTLFAKQRITTPNTTSKRFPIVGGIFADTLVVNYLIDSIAGFGIIGEGRTTNNPEVCHFVPVPFPSAEIELQPHNNATQLTLDISPNPFSTQTAIRFSLPAQTKVSLQLYDVSGRLIQTLIDKYQSAGSYSLKIDNWKLKIPRGVYFCTLKTDNKAITRKIVKTH